MASVEIESYIAQLSDQLESGGQGRFTQSKLPRSKAMLEAADRYPFRWAYFAIQAALTAPATHVDVCCRGGSVSVEFQLSEADSDYLSTDWLAGDALVPHRPSLKFWSQATLWAAALEPAGIKILCEGAHPGYLVTVLGEDALKQVLPSQNRRTRLALIVDLNNQAKRQQELARYLVDNLVREMAYVTLPIRLHGNTPAFGHPVVKNYRRVCLALARPEEGGGLGFVTPSQLDFGEYRLPDRRGFVFRDASPDAAQLDLSGAVGSRLAVRTATLSTQPNRLSLRADSDSEWLLPLDYEPKIPGTNLIRCRSLAFFRPGRPSRLFPVHHGLALLPIELPDVPEGWDTFWPMPLQSTDYPGLAIVQDETFQEQRREAEAWIAGRHA